MSADENVSISIDDAAVDNAISKLNEALAKKEQLTGQATQNDPNGFIINESPAEAKQIKRNRETQSDFAAFWGNLDKQAADAQRKAEDVIKNEGTEIKGLDSATTKILNRLPYLREARRLYSSIEAVSAGSVAGVVSLLLIAYTILQQVLRMQTDQERQRLEYKNAIMQAQGFTNTAQFQTWENQQNAALQSYKSRPIVK